MNIHLQSSSRRGGSGFTLVEMLIAMALGGIVLAMVMGAFTYSGTSFAAMGNYADLDRNSRNAVDVLSREIRDSSALIAFSTNSPKFLTFSNATTGNKVTITYDSGSRTLNLAKTGQTTYALLTQCDQWDFSLYNRSPNITSTNITFYGATNTAGVLDASACKLVNMTWKCSRTIFGSKRNTETIQTAELVLRNKVK